MLALGDLQRAVATVAVFIVTFFLTLAIGRLLKRRAGVRLGLFFQLFAFALSFYGAAWTYGMDMRWRAHAGAAVALLSTAVVIALVDRYLWGYYFEQRRQIIIPKLLRELVALIILLIALLLVLSIGYHAERQLRGLLAGSGVAAIILAFATQNLLGGVIAGMSLQINKPYKVGDWLQVGEQFAEVMEINWRSTRLRTNDAVYLDIPNNEIVRQTIVNLHYPEALHAMRIVVGVDYNVPPNRVKDALLQATLRAEGVEKVPAPKVFLKEFGDFAILYEIKFYLLDHASYNEVCDAIRTNIWYKFRRQKITIPYPIRTLELTRKAINRPEEEHDQTKSILEGEPLFQCLTSPQLDLLIRGSRRVRFGRGEKIIEQGAEGASMFVLLHGAAAVSVSQNGSAMRLASLSMGDCFGEMSLLTGEKRSATVSAEDDCEVMEISQPAMAAVLRETPECLGQLSELLATRRLETEGALKNLAESIEDSRKANEYRASFLERLRSVFEL